jgi:GNAT superfamily N-acetyltransferase
MLPGGSSRRMKLRRLTDTPEEIAVVDRLLVRAYGFGSRRAELEMYFRAQPDGWFVLEDRGEIVAVAGAIAYGHFCWVGLVATDPGRQRQGLATTISRHCVEWARVRGCATIALDASGAGRPVYERLGFQAVGGTAELSLPPEIPDASGSTSVRRASREGIDALLGLDRRIFGADRGRLLRDLSRQDDARCYVAEISGEVRGYLFARKRLLGPGCAVDEASARELVRAALADRIASGVDGRPHLLLPIESRYRDLLLGLGLRIERRLAHMRLGDSVLPGERAQLLAQMSYASG